MPQTRAKKLVRKIDDQAKKHLILRRAKLAKLNQFCQYENTDPDTFIALIIQYPICCENIIRNLSENDIKSLKCVHKSFSNIIIPKGKTPNYQIRYRLHPPYNFKVTTLPSDLQDIIILDIDFTRAIDDYSFIDEISDLTLSNWKLKIENEIVFLEKYFSLTTHKKIKLFEEIKKKMREFHRDIGRNHYGLEREYIRAPLINASRIENPSIWTDKLKF